MILDDEIEITLEDGTTQVMKILFTYENEERGHSYVFIYKDGEEDDVMPFIYNEEDKSLSEIEDEEEFGEVEEVFNAFIDEKII